MNDFRISILELTLLLIEIFTW